MSSVWQCMYVNVCQCAPPPCAPPQCAPPQCAPHNVEGVGWHRGEGRHWKNKTEGERWWSLKRKRQPGTASDLSRTMTRSFRDCPLVLWRKADTCPVGLEKWSPRGVPSVPQRPSWDDNTAASSERDPARWGGISARAKPFESQFEQHRGSPLLFIPITRFSLFSFFSIIFLYISSHVKKKAGGISVSIRQPWTVSLIKLPPSVLQWFLRVSETSILVSQTRGMSCIQRLGLVVHCQDFRKFH